MKRQLHAVSNSPAPRVFVTSATEKSPSAMDVLRAGGVIPCYSQQIGNTCLITSPANGTRILIRCFIDQSLHVGMNKVARFS